MNETLSVLVNDRLRGTVDATSWPPHTSHPVPVLLDDGRRIEADARRFERRTDGSLALAVDAGELEAALRGAGIDTDAERLVIPVLEERLEVGSRRVETGRVRIVKTVREETQIVDRPLLKDQVTVDRVPVGTFITGPVATRFDGDTMIVSVVEEVLVVEKRLMLKEELHIRRVQVEHNAPQEVTVRSEEARVERVAPRENPPA